MPTDKGFRIQLIVTVVVALAVLWVGIETGDWTGLVLVVPLAIMVPIVARLPAERPTRRPRQERDAPPTKSEEPRRY